MNCWVFYFTEHGVESAKAYTEVLFSQSPEALLRLSQAEMTSLFRSTSTTEMYLEPPAGRCLIQSSQRAASRA